MLVISILKTKDVLNILLNNKKLSQEMYDKTNEFLNTNKSVSITQVKEKSKVRRSQKCIKTKLNFF